MKVCYINTVYKEKSTGRTYMEMKNFLEKQGHECQVHFGHGKNKEKNVFRICNNFSYYLHNILSRITGLQGYFSYFSTNAMIKKIKQFNPDVVHLGNLHGNYLHLPTLFKYLNKAQKPVFVTSHDCWFFTGKCTHFIGYNCDKYKSQCFDCPAKNVYPKSYFFDFSKKMYRDKKRWFTTLKNLNIICVSNWMVDNLRKSFLKDKNIYQNYNWVNTDIFRSISQEERTEIRKSLGLSEKEKLVITVSSIWDNRGLRYLDVIKLLQKLSENEKILVIGGNSGDFTKNERLIHIPFVSDVKLLAKYYASSDVFVHFSREDTFGKVIAEAQCCGTPVIVYDVTACGEIAKLGNGYAVEKGNVEEVYKTIKQILSLSENQVLKDRTERERTVSNVFSKEVRMNNLYNIYVNSLKNGVENKSC